MKAPLVCAVMLVNGRPEMVKRAVASFRAQTYPNKRLYLYDSSMDKCATIDALPHQFSTQGIVYHGTHEHGKTIGALRNVAIRWACESWPVDIFVTMDSDDWSHPNRIAEQVALLQASGKECVGYREVVFWDTRRANKPTGDTIPGPLGAHPVFSFAPDEAYLYTNNDPRYLIGASMCYWRSAWEACPFDDAPHEDQRWWLKNSANCLGASANHELWVHADPIDASSCGLFGTDPDVYRRWTPPPVQFISGNPMEPRLICGVHGGNTESYADMTGTNMNWRRAPEFDEVCRERMAL